MKRTHSIKASCVVTVHWYQHNGLSCHLCEWCKISCFLIHLVPTKCTYSEL